MGTESVTRREGTVSMLLARGKKWERGPRDSENVGEGEGVLMILSLNILVVKQSLKL